MVHLCEPGLKLGTRAVTVRYRGKETAWRLYVHASSLLASSTDHARTYYHYASDEMGSTTHIVDGDGAVVNRYVYDAWGNVTEQTENVPNRFKFNGQQLDPISQQYYLQARFYNPVIARFTQEDTYRGDGLNLYAYCANNPVYYADPSGNMCDPAAARLQARRDAGERLTREQQRDLDAYNRERVKATRLHDDTLVVRGGVSSPDNLTVNQVGDSRGHISANAANGVSLDVLATTPAPFRNGQISVTTVGAIRDTGMDVIADPTAHNPYHASIVPPTIPITPSDADALSALFERKPNEWRDSSK